MYPVLFEIGPITVYSFGLMLSLGFALAILVAFFNARRHGLDPWVIIDMGLWLFLAGLLGSRLLYVVLNWDEFAGQPAIKLIATWEGGVAFYGAISGGFLAALVFARLHKLSLARIADTVAPGLAIAAAVGRLGCFLNGCCHGIETSGFWGTLTRFAPGLRHPTQLYESAAYFGVFAFLLWWQKRHAKVPGQLFLTFVIAYIAGRYAIEFFREGQRLYPWLTLTQAASLVILAVAVAVYVYLGRRTTGRHAAGAGDQSSAGSTAPEA